MLEDEGYTVRSAADSGGALEAVEDRRPSMVLLDVWLQGSRLDGIELLRFLAEQDYQSPVLIVSVFDRRVLESAFRLGEAIGLNMAGPLEKPVRLEELEALLGQLRATLVQ